MVIKINIRSTTLMLAMILVLMSTNAVAVAQEGTDPELGITPVPTRTNLEGDRHPIDLSRAEPRAVIPGGPGFISIHPSAFQPKNSSSSYDFYPNDGLSELFNTGSNIGYYLAPVDIPDHATINKMVVYFFDQVNDALHIKVALYQCDIGYGGCTEIGSVITGVGPDYEGYGFAEDLVITNQPVNLQTKSYAMYLEIPGGQYTLLTLVNVRVDYGYDPIYFPSVNN
jgi:hypothetical protein